MRKPSAIWVARFCRFLARSFWYQAFPQSMAVANLAPALTIQEREFSRPALPVHSCIDHLSRFARNSADYPQLESTSDARPEWRMALYLSKSASRPVRLHVRTRAGCCRADLAGRCRGG